MKIGLKVFPYSQTTFSVRNKIGGYGPNTLWPSKLPENTPKMFSVLSFLANGGTEISAPANNFLAEANPNFYQMSPHDIHHSFKYILRYCLDAIEAPIERAIFDPTMKGEISADRWDGFMEAVTEAADRTLSLPVTETKKTPEELVAYTLWDTIFDNLRSKLHLLHTDDSPFESLEAFHKYSKAQMLSDIFAEVTEGELSPELKFIKQFFERHYNLNINTSELYNEAEQVILDLQALLEHDIREGHLQQIGKNYYFVPDGLLGQLYYISRSAGMSLQCPISDPTTQLKQELRGNPFVYKVGTSILNYATKMFKEAISEDSKRTKFITELKKAISMKLIKLLGQISYSFCILPTKH